MANKLPWTTPKVQTLYTTSSVGRLIAEYLDAGGQMLQMREGVLGHGDVLLYDDAGKLKTYVIREVAINEWSSGHKVRGYNRMPEKYRDNGKKRTAGKLPPSFCLQLKAITTRKPNAITAPMVTSG